MRPLDPVVIVVEEYGKTPFSPSVRHRRPWWKTWAAGAIGTGLIHALLALPLLGGGAAAKQVPPKREPEPIYMTLLQLPSASITIGPASDAFAFDLPALDIPTPMLPPDAMVDEAMFGRYVGQVSARVERAWIRPRTAIGAAEFQCWARIEQDRDGKVLSVELQQCNGDTRWQLSLVAAIERASPLSAPPDRAVFSSVLHIQFSSVAFVAGAATDAEYEPDLTSVTQITQDSIGPATGGAQ